VTHNNPTRNAGNHHYRDQEKSITKRHVVSGWKNELRLSHRGNRWKPPNVRVDRAARFHPTFAAPFKLPLTLPPLRSNALFEGDDVEGACSIDNMKDD
jgi:hypothetical protein